ncbi:rRNA methyltransferase [Candidatus Aerophobetes bacterium]|uniref:rRNA methyltransferase n=1 Tax=Aerophobetes bacterium TaxID=2030807 RepID=A0A2A4YHS7_UNCAE|nr:MAG: rRNA methyltransferase [Candidatus Aerophobetes bacterium]
MTPIEVLTSHQNPKIKQIIKLRDKRARDKTKKFLIEGFRELSRAIHFGYPIESVFFSREHFLGVNEEALLEKCGKTAMLYELPDYLFEKISYRDRPDGLLAIAPIIGETLSSFEKKVLSSAKDEPLLLLIAESIEKPGNLGSILRSSDAAGVHGVILTDKKTDVFNPNVVRASIGTLFSVPILECSSSDAFSFLEKHKVKLVATTPHTDSLFTEVDLKGPIAIAMGTEQLGLSDEILKRSEIKVKIPMFGIADSLNVAASATLAIYEAVRQRGLAL